METVIESKNENKSAKVLRLNKDTISKYDLTQRECSILELIINEGLNNTELGKRLFLSVNSIKLSVSSILRKFEVKDKIRVVIKILEEI